MNCTEGALAWVVSKSKSARWLDGRVVVCTNHVVIENVDSWTIYPPLLRDDGRRVVTAIPDAWLQPFAVDAKGADETLSTKVRDPDGL